MQQSIRLTSETSKTWTFEATFMVTNSSIANLLHVSFSFAL